MEFAKYYNVTKKLNELLDKGGNLGYEKGYYDGMFICCDVHDIWICRILEGFNEDYEKDEDIWLIERNKISKYDFCDYLKEKFNDDSITNDRFSRDFYIDNCFELNQILENIILMDDEEGLENWNTVECDSYDECVNIIDGGFGIIEQ